MCGLIDEDMSINEVDLSTHNLIDIELMHSILWNCMCDDR